jgi:2-methylcitrate dehydratase PrpD
VLDLFVGQPFELGETPQVDAAFSIRYTVANALLRKSVWPEHFSDEAIRDPQISKLISLIKLPGKLIAGGPVSCEIKVKMKDERVYSASNSAVKGDIAHNPLSYAEILTKYRHNVAFSKTVSRANSEKALAMVEKLEELKNVQQLTSLLI